MPDITIDGTSISGITIDGTKVQEVTIDGNVAWTASQVIDDFEDNDTGEWAKGNITATSSVNNGSVISGSYSGNLYDAGSSVDDYSTSGLPAYPSQGDTFQGWVRTTQGSDVGIGYHWGLQDSSNKYRIHFRTWTNEIMIDVMSGGSKTHLSKKSFDMAADTWYRIKVDWQTDGTMAVTVYNSSGTKLVSISATDTTYSSGGIGAHMYDGSGSGQNGYYDGFEIL